MRHICIARLIPFTLAIVGILGGCTPPPAKYACVPECAPGFTCDTSSGNCVPGASDQPDLSATPDGGSCDPRCVSPTPFCNKNRQCVGCLADGDCPSGQVCRTSNLGAACAPGCTDDSRCGNGQKCCNGACADLTKDVANCGACGTACAATHARPTCVASVCKAGTCDSGWGDCNNDGKDGCETNLHVDPENCTACGMSCKITNAITACSDGCYAKACKWGFDDCNNDMKDGCETSVASDPKNCGKCGQNCSAPPHAKASCLNATCAVTSCDVGYADCDGNGVNGCETATGTDAKNCGACGNACANGLVCTNGGCTCPQCNFANASSKCVNNVCMLDQCVQGFADCDKNPANGCEINLNTDAANCSACGMPCANGLVCSGGTCQMILCQNLGWKTGNANWACPNGLRMPTVNEFAKVQSCITQKDTGMFGYYNDIATVVGGCNCKWNGGWCGQPSIETIRGGRMCGDYAQLHICVN